MAFAMALRTSGPFAMVTVGGDLDVASAEPFRSFLHELVRDDTHDVIVDLRRLDFLDAAGLSTLVDARLRLVRGGRQLWVTCDQPRILRLFEICGLHETFDVYPHPASDGTLDRPRP
ncbi:STAS domain-containing protein [Aeromicrobium massiliense]|uniref:STAS domain-containing protein n=1 Tax=Aeromicrobium massiliense TaxID=1464554 RepID=UPI0005781E02|nr:STAS domain-containing protein [Aeromicrobium massiliense]